MKLEKSIKILRNWKVESISALCIYDTISVKEFNKSIETILQALDNSIPKEKIENFIKEELPNNEICETCAIYDVNGIEIKKKLQELLEE